MINTSVIEMFSALKTSINQKAQHKLSYGTEIGYHVRCLVAYLNFEQNAKLWWLPLCFFHVLIRTTKENELKLK